MSAAASVARLAPFLPGLEKVLMDPDVSEVMINGPGGAWVEKKGEVSWVDAARLTARSLASAALQIVRPLRSELSREKPLADARLEDGSRVAVAIPPAARHTTITIRRFGGRQFSADDLVRTGSLPAEVRAAVQAALGERRNILVSGGTGSGKTTLLSAFCALVSDHDRVLVIEDTMELRIPARNCVRFEAAKGASIRDLVRHALRHRPDRIIVGEVRGGEASDLLDALSTGHGGSMSTIHANSAQGALSRLAVCVLQGADPGQSYQVVCHRVCEAVDLVIQVARIDGWRGVVEAIEVEDYDRGSDSWRTRSLWNSGGPGTPANGSRRYAPVLSEGLPSSVTSALEVTTSVR